MKFAVKRLLRLLFIGQCFCMGLTSWSVAESTEIIVASIKAKLDNDKFTDAAVECSIALARHPNDVALKECEAVIFYRLGQHANAMKAATAILENHQESHNAWFVVGMVQWRNRNLAAAINALRSALEINPEEPDYHATLGVLYKETGRYEEAIEQWSLEKKYREKK